MYMSCIIIVRNRVRLAVYRDRKRKENKEIKTKQTPLAGLCFLVGCWFGSGPQKEKKEKEESVWFVVCNRGPKGVGGPRSLFRVSCRGPKILVRNLGNFRRLRKYINIVW